MVKKKREEYKSKVQFVALNRSIKLEGKSGTYDGRPITSKFVPLGDLAELVKREADKEKGVISVYDN